MIVITSLARQGGRRYGQTGLAGPHRWLPSVAGIVNTLNEWTSRPDRVAGAIYQNASGVGRFVAVVTQGLLPGRLSFTAYCDSSTPPTGRILGQYAVTTFNAGMGNPQAGTLFFRVPINWYYEIVVTTGTIVSWQELDES